MRVIEPGHIYQVTYLDGPPEDVIITFVNREETQHAGTQTQEILRVSIDMMEVLIDRTNHCDSCLRWERNDQVVKAMAEAQRQMRLALLFHEQRAMERKMDKDDVMPETISVAKDGHFEYPITKVDSKP